MKQTPLKHYRSPKYPELNRENEESVHLLLNKQMPARWKRLAASAAMLCTTAGLMEGCFAKHAEKAETEQVEIKPNKSILLKRDNTVTVAPLAPAIFTHARGGFGCVAVTAPAYLSEDEAKEIIFDELNKHGIRLQPNFVITRKAKTKPKQERWRTMTDKEKSFALPDFQRETLSFKLDWFDPKKGVAVELMSTQDERFWNVVAQYCEDPLAKPVFSSFEVHDYRISAPAFAKVIETFKSEQPVKVGLFAPPFIYLTQEENHLADSFYQAYYKKYEEALPSALYKKDIEAYWRKREAFEKANDHMLQEAKSKSHAYLKKIGKSGEPELRAQVRHFVKWLEEQEKKQ